MDTTRTPKKGQGELLLDCFPSVSSLHGGKWSPSRIVSDCLDPTDVEKLHQALQGAFMSQITTPGEPKDCMGRTYAQIKKDLEQVRSHTERIKQNQMQMNNNQLLSLESENSTVHELCMMKQPRLKKCLVAIEEVNVQIQMTQITKYADEFEKALKDMETTEDWMRENDLKRMKDKIIDMRKTFDDNARDLGFTGTEAMEASTVWAMTSGGMTAAGLGTSFAICCSEAAIASTLGFVGVIAGAGVAAIGAVGLVCWGVRRLLRIPGDSQSQEMADFVIESVDSVIQAHTACKKMTTALGGMGKRLEKHNTAASEETDRPWKRAPWHRWLEISDGCQQCRKDKYS